MTFSEIGTTPNSPLFLKHTFTPQHVLELIYLDDSFIAVNKVAGLLAVPGRGADKQDCLAGRVQAEFSDALVVHRLDMATSGLLLFARGVEMQRRLSQMFREREIQKRYVALVLGRIKSANMQSAPSRNLTKNERGCSLLLPSGEGWEGGWSEIALPLIGDWPNRPKQKVDHESGKHSLTRYRSLINGADTGASRVELEAVTGRTHQLRVHMAAIGHPILGDALYNVETGVSAKRLMLHACSLSFKHPLSGEPLSLTSDPPF